MPRSMTIGRTHYHYHAPWSRWFRTFYIRGEWAHELQVGPVVFQVPRRGDAGARWPHGRLHIWKDRY